MYLQNTERNKLYRYTDVASAGGKMFFATFHKHKFEQIGFAEEIKNNLRYSIRLYQCKICGKEIWVDGRNDTIKR